jgi:hypothetical protein
MRGCPAHARGAHREQRSGSDWRSAGLRVGAGSASRKAERLVTPDHTCGMAVGCCERRHLRRVGRCARVQNTTDRAGTVMGAMLATLITLLAGSGSAIMTDGSQAKRVGSGDGGGPARADRCQNLHHQRDQDDRKEFLQMPPHFENLLKPGDLSNHRGNAESRLLTAARSPTGQATLNLFAVMRETAHLVRCSGGAVRALPT